MPKTISLRSAISSEVRQSMLFVEVPVTGKSFEVVAMEWFEIKDGKIDRRWGARDNAAQFRQMGLPLS